MEHSVGNDDDPRGLGPPDADEGTNDFGDVGYGGSNPPDREHRSRFKFFAVETTFDLPADTDVADLGSAAEGRVIEQTQLDGTYPA